MRLALDPLRLLLISLAEWFNLRYAAYVTNASSKPRSSVPSGDAESPRYSVKFDHAATTVGDLIQCIVHAERVGFRGYGMMLAEVGLLPVPRWIALRSIQPFPLPVRTCRRYEVQPDRVVFYLWPRAGGTTFSFTFKPRFAMTAQSSESILYDYYNPEARASVPPTRFTVK